MRLIRRVDEDLNRSGILGLGTPISGAEQIALPATQAGGLEGTIRGHARYMCHGNKTSPPRSRR